MRPDRLLYLGIVVTLVACAVGLLFSHATFPASNQTYIGNLRSHIFHRTSCKYLPCPENRRHFDSRSDAIDADYRPCRRCRP